MHAAHPPPSRSGPLPWWLVAFAFTAIVTFLLWEEHQAHILGALPYLFLLACLLMHLFMHRGHHAHHDGGKRDAR